MHFFGLQRDVIWQSRWLREPMHECTMLLVAIIVRHEGRKPVPSLTKIMSLCQHSLIATERGTWSYSSRRKILRGLDEKLADLFSRSSMTSACLFTNSNDFPSTLMSIRSPAEKSNMFSGRSCTRQDALAMNFGLFCCPLIEAAIGKIENASNDWPSFWSGWEGKTSAIEKDLSIKCQ